MISSFLHVVDFLELDRSGNRGGESETCAMAHKSTSRHHWGILNQRSIFYGQSGH
jgi:hypothetical protein